MKFYSFLIITIYILFGNVHSQVKVDTLVVSDTTNQVYAVLKSGHFNEEDKEGTSAEFLSDFFAHLKMFGKEYKIKINFFESSEIYYNNKKIEFEQNRASMILFIKRKSKDFYKIDGIASSAVLLQEAKKFYGK